MITLMPVMGAFYIYLYDSTVKFQIQIAQKMLIHFLDQQLGSNSGCRLY